MFWVVSALGTLPMSASDTMFTVGVLPSAKVDIFVTPQVMHVTHKT